MAHNILQIVRPCSPLPAIHESLWKASVKSHHCNSVALNSLAPLHVSSD